MSSIVPIRDPRTDALLTPQNAALLVIDYQPVQVSSVASRDRRSLVTNATDVAAIMRIVQAGAQPISWVQLACELQRDWNRTSTAPGFGEIVFSAEGA